MTEKMTAEQATEFKGFSQQNAMLLALAAEERGCECQPYKDWFTYQRWLAQGYQVQKGEHGVPLSTFIPVTVKKEDGTEVQSGMRPWRTNVFCRCQVKKIESVENS